MSDRKDAADYVADLAGELATIAKAAELPLSAYLLEMAKLEARRAVSDDGPHRPPARSGMPQARSD